MKFVRFILFCVNLIASLLLYFTAIARFKSTIKLAVEFVALAYPVIY
jgi:hypothetical protein